MGLVSWFGRAENPRNEEQGQAGVCSLRTHGLDEDPLPVTGHDFISKGYILATQTPGLGSI